MPPDTDAVDAALASAGPGARLKAAREAAGLSLDQVAQQLKLAPRQVKALEDESFGDLPGRTFSRGFVRNYARLLHLDAQDLLAHLPDSAHAPALESPTLHSTATMMAELPSSYAPRASLGRWLIPLILVGCIVGAAVYEWYRGGLSGGNSAVGVEPPRAVSGATLKDAPGAAPVVPVTGTAASVALPNPLASSAQTPAPAASMVDSGAGSVAPAGTPSATPAAPPAAAASGVAASMSPAPDVAPPPASAVAGDAPILLTYRGPSWTEIRDRTGQVIISRLVAPGAIEPVKGTPPFDVILGNAHVVTLEYRGRPIDLVPHTRQNVARLTLQ